MHEVHAHRRHHMDCAALLMLSLPASAESAGLAAALAAAAECWPTAARRCAWPTAANGWLPSSCCLLLCARPWLPLLLSDHHTT